MLLLGQSGSGKSDLALRLIAMGARLVADDRCEIFFDGNTLRARAPRSIAGVMEIRGLGIVGVPCASEARIALVVRIADAVERMPELRAYESPSALAVPEHLRLPEIAIDAFAASAAAKILAAVAAFEKQLFHKDIPV
ncbi:MAG TPA: hypothetical protein VHT03_11595 [Rhizomicrobium sp.]|nr:hypothetical protein [Rhizomicrobium sp.]